MAADGSGRLVAISEDGSEAAQAEFGHVTHLAYSPEGVCAAALEDGRLLLLGPDLAVLHDSPAAEDDVETLGLGSPSDVAYGPRRVMWGAF